MSSKREQVRDDDTAEDASTTVTPRDGVVATLFEVERGDRLAMTAQKWNWETPFVVVELNERRQENAFDGGERWRDITIAPEKHRTPGSGWSFSVCSLSGAPVLGESYGPLTDVEIVDQAPPEELVDFADWLDVEPSDAVESAAISRTLSEVLDAAETYDNLVQMTQRLGSPNVQKTRKLCDELGLLVGDQLAEDDVLAERVELLREVYADD